MYNIIIKSDCNNKGEYFWWVLRGGNNNILSTSEMYTTRRSAYRTAKKLADALKIKIEK